MAYGDLCIRCKELVRPRQEGLQCDGCERWQYRTCNSGVSRHDYRNAVKGGQDIEWRCEDCLNMSAGFAVPLAESTRNAQEGEPKESNQLIEEIVDVLVDMENDEEVPMACNSPTSSQAVQSSTRSPIVEPSIMDPPIGDIVVGHAPVTYRIVEGGTKRRKISLVDTIGFSYNIHSKRSYATYWQCTVRLKGKPCKASVIERNGYYRAGMSAHNHQIEAGGLTAAKVVAAVKEKALEEKFRPASSIVAEVLMNDLKNDEPCAALPKPQHIARAANRLRQKLRPQDPKDLQFELQEQCIPDGFFRADIIVKERRHLVFAKNEQLRILCKAKSWYVDGTFKLVRHPFKQLLTINAFVRSGNHAKQVPLVYVLMCGRNTKDLCFAK